MTEIRSSVATLAESAPLPRVEFLTEAKLHVVIDFIEVHISEKFSLRDLAAMAGDSPFHFARKFSRMTGLTPHQYVIGRRVERARQLLEQDELSIATIAVETGFSSQSHLTEVFRRSVGVTPGVYRADHSRVSFVNG
jgi:AraC family transcriptional regulator